ncbi:MAG: hypothetical protein COV02_00040 [Candidatus Terrybacteria bacterium CG10_big_fil_rev_8_21_14_0_10_41_10]|uniref:DNA-directed DNA polymerase n=1 Tax=Candidatus Terrybacteria bacterium CG10_big_fil_rev_8_21_14_0_10_41_10 TaxID=1975026 RepID=A0A2M8LC09_9BACT|nr:MAG: hypothetical protein COV02_00040 [Candidatus Terrybacteria bacterium CG10_big_fil_rev_8_21_14_0_10_41_10]
MIYLFHGKDTYRSKRKLNDVIASFRNKGSNFAFFNIEEGGFSFLLMEELLRSQSLFEKKNVVVFNRIFEDVLAREFILKKLKEISESPNIFLFWEEDVKKSYLDEISEFISKAQEFGLLEKNKVKDFLGEELKNIGLKIDVLKEVEIIEKYGSDLWGIISEIEKIALMNDLKIKDSSARKDYDYNLEKVNIFHITDAFGRKDKKTAWVLYQKALLSGLPAEEVFWKLSWQVKNILLVKRMSEELKKDKEEIIRETGLNPFVVKNCLNFAKNFEAEKLSALYLALIDIYHKARSGKSEFDSSIEKFLLSY